jgi:hypothetical protein
MRLKARTVLPLAVVALVCLMGATDERQGCGDGLDNRKGEPGVDVGGRAGAQWDVSYTDEVEVIIKDGAAIVASHNVSLASGGTFDLDGATIDWRTLCARDDVACPEDVFPATVMMKQPGSKLHLLYVDFNPVGPLAEVDEATLLGNVDSDFDFSIALGIGAAGAGPCGLLSVSYATGSIEHDGDDPPTGNALSGEIVTAYAGGCLLLGANGGGAGAGLTAELRLPFTASRR